MSFGETLKQLRIKHQLTQQDLGNILGISNFAISNFELQVEIPDFDTLRAISNYFNTSLDHLLGTYNQSLCVNSSLLTDDTKELPKEVQKDIYEFTNYLKFKYQSIAK